MPPSNIKHISNLKKIHSGFFSNKRDRKNLCGVNCTDSRHTTPSVIITLIAAILHDNYKGGNYMKEKKNEKRTKIIVIPHYEGRENAAKLLKQVISDQLRKKSKKQS